MYLQDLPCLDDAAEDEFPDTSTALNYPTGLLAFGGRLSPARLQAAYRCGIFPWFSDGEPVLWWTPSPRCVLYPADVYVSTRTRRR
ncbi:MAG: leucyl/phenylalanyl-tRNA--protein transferase, partial [Xanthomonadales bacterium]|nr:leucyl/phenylalanyl-tRNA--protein transferase [Xanthomonadales bacterium]